MTEENVKMVIGTLKCLAVDVEMMRRGCCPLNLESMANRIETMLEIAGTPREHLAAYIKNEIINMVGPEEYEYEERPAEYEDREREYNA
jgi:hypothetical protein